MVVCRSSFVEVCSSLLSCMLCGLAHYEYADEARMADRGSHCDLVDRDRIFNDVMFVSWLGNTYMAVDCCLRNSKHQVAIP